MKIDQVSFDEADLVGLVSDARGVVPALVERAEADAVGLKNEEIHHASPGKRTRSAPSRGFTETGEIGSPIDSSRN